MSQEIRRPVRLLRDDHGIYGIGSDLIVMSGTPRREIQLTLILRSDRLTNVEVDDHLNHLSRHGWWILQAIPVGRWPGLYSSLEERLRREVHHELLRRAGLVNENLSEGFPQPKRNWWSSSRKQQDRNRRKFHGLKINSVAIVNTLIRQALAEAADQNALKVARRFPSVYRYPIYRAAALSPRALQLAETFPVLAAALYSKANAAQANLVEAGAPLHHVAEAMNIPMALRKIKPGAAVCGLRAAEIAARDPDLFHTDLPDSLPRARLWLRAIDDANNLAGTDFMEWTAKHCFEISNEFEVMRTTLTDLSDWVRACGPAINTQRTSVEEVVPRRPSRGHQFVTRPFSPNMSLQTVMKLSAEWHEAVSNNMDGPDHAFPPPWCAAGQSAGYEIIPITTSGELYREGRAMHHCAGGYDKEVQNGCSYLFSIREDGKRIATLELVRWSTQICVGQLRGPCNAQVSNAVQQAVQVWLREQSFNTSWRLSDA